MEERGIEEALIRVLRSTSTLWNYGRSRFVYNSVCASDLGAWKI